MGLGFRISGFRVWPPAREAVGKRPCGTWENAAGALCSHPRNGQPVLTMQAPSIIETAVLQKVFTRVRGLGLGFRVEGTGYWVQGSGFRV